LIAIGLVRGEFHFATVDEIAGWPAGSRAGPRWGADGELERRLGAPLSDTALGHLGAALAALRAATPHASRPDGRQ